MAAAALASPLAFAALAFGVVLISPAPASAHFFTETFGYTGGEQTFTVPAGTTEVWMRAFGGNGGGGGGGGTPLRRHASGGSGGHGGVAETSLKVRSGERLTVIVGGRGASPGTDCSVNASGGRSPGSLMRHGGSGGRPSCHVRVGGGGGGGGGASEVLSGDRLVVLAGGGGGGGGGGCFHDYNGGSGGSGGGRPRQRAEPPGPGGAGEGNGNGAGGAIRPHGETEHPSGTSGSDASSGSAAGGGGGGAGGLPGGHGGNGGTGGCGGGGGGAGGWSSESVPIPGSLNPGYCGETGGNGCVAFSGHCPGPASDVAGVFGPNPLKFDSLWFHPAAGRAGVFGLAAASSTHVGGCPSPPPPFTG